MDSNEYRGWKNRSTWLVSLHLNNTNEDVYKEARAVATHADYINRLKSTLNQTDIKKEQDYNIKEVDWEMIRNSLIED